MTSDFKDKEIEKKWLERMIDEYEDILKGWKSRLKELEQIK